MADTTDAESLWTAFLASSASDRAAILDQLSGEQLGAVLGAMGVDDRRRALAAMPRDELAGVLAKAPLDVIVRLVKSDFLEAEREPRRALLDALPPPRLGDVLAALGVVGRREALGKISKEEQAEILGRLSQEALIALGRQGVSALGIYRAQLTKRERIRGTLSVAQTLELTVRPEPFAFRLEFKSGPSSGRRALYNAEIRKDEIRIKEGGMLGIAGALWLQLDNPLTRMDTNHRATEIGFAALLDLMETDMAKAAAAGAKHSRRDVGFEGDTYGCVFDAPPGVAGLYAVSTRIGFDIASSLPVSIDVHDDKGLLESYRYSAAKGVSVAADFFTLKAASL